LAEERKKGSTKERKKKSRQKKKESNPTISEIVTALIEENSQFKHVNKH
tara:strand:+ start:175 stop:321 length:147 start_codon:yes stop_codon:yes gene_type:complete